MSESGLTGQATEPIKFASISLAASGEVVAAVTGKKIRVLGYVLAAAGAVSVNWENGTTDISGVTSLITGTPVSYAGGWDAPAVETSAGAALNLTLSGAVQVSGHVTYIEVD
jgi:hypothetical protein